MINPLIARLRAMTSLSAHELQSIDNACSSVRNFAARVEIASEGEVAQNIHVVMSGWACRYKLLSDGRRQITALALPGDICDLDSLLLRRTHYGIATLTKCEVAVVPHHYLRTMLNASSAIQDVLWWLTLVENSISTQGMLCLGRLSTTERLAHLLCEIATRLTIAGVIDGERISFPITQEELADVLGVTNVHVNRTLQDLRSTGSVSLEFRHLTIHNLSRLAEIGRFTPDYLLREGLRASEELASTRPCDRKRTSPPLATAGGC
jgi:CRP-like cAMP-binding protein